MSEKYHEQYDPEASMREARGRGYDLRRVMSEHGCGFPGAGKKLKCPFCGEDATLFVKEGRELFKCWHKTCSSGLRVMDEVGFIAAKGNLNRKEAFVAYLKMAGVWKEREKWKSGMNQRISESVNDPGARVCDPQQVDAPSAVEAAAGHRPALRPSAESDALGTDESAAGHSAIRNPQSAIENLAQTSAEDGAPVADAPAIPAGALPDPPPLGAEGSAPEAPGELEEANSAPPGSAGVPPVAEVDTGSPSRRDAGAPGSNIIPIPTASTSRPSRRPLRDAALVAIERFYAGLTWTVEDDAACFAKRGLESETQAALGLRSSLKSNAELLEALRGEFSVLELAESGLWKGADRKGNPPRPSAQYYGYGIKGHKNKKELKPGEREEIWGWTYPNLIPYFTREGKLRKIRPHKGGSEGETVNGAPMLYVPRAAGTAALPGEEASREVEAFDQVVICEGEYKAMAVRQELRADGWGACALPGINMAKSVPLREELEVWLDEVGAREVYVAFDREVKDDPALPNYKEDWTKRHDTLIYAEYLALDLHKKLGLKTYVCLLPEAWMRSGKADWDGALAQIVGCV